MKIKKYKFGKGFLPLPVIMRYVDCKHCYHTVYSRIKRGKTIEEALFEPVIKRTFEPSDEWLKMGD